MFKVDIKVESSAYIHTTGLASAWVERGALQQRFSRVNFCLFTRFFFFNFNNFTLSISFLSFGVLRLFSILSGFALTSNLFSLLQLILSTRHARHFVSSSNFTCYAIYFLSFLCYQIIASVR